MQMSQDRLNELTAIMKASTTQTRKMAQELTVGAGHLAELEEAADHTGTQIDELTDGIGRLRGELDQEQAALDYKQAVDEFGQAMVDAKGDTDAQSQALIDIKGKMLDYLESVQGVPPSKQTEILALIDQGKLDEAERLLNALARTRTATVQAGVGQFSGSSGSGSGSGGNKSGKVGVAADGGVVTRATLAMIGEAGPEAVVPLSQMPGARALGGGGGAAPIITLNAYGVTDPRQLIDMLNKELRRNGSATL
jgi:phage-related tail protein